MKKTYTLEKEMFVISHYKTSKPQWIADMTGLKLSVVYDIGRKHGLAKRHKKKKAKAAKAQQNHYQPIVETPTKKQFDWIPHILIGLAGGLIGSMIVVTYF